MDATPITSTTPRVCFWCKTQCGGTCLRLRGSTQMRTDDPAYWLLSTGYVSTPTVHRDGCYICEDPEFAQMGMPLCYPCPSCGGHIPADDTMCDDCGAEDGPECPPDGPPDKD